MVHDFTMLILFVIVYSLKLYMKSLVIANGLFFDIISNILNLKHVKCIINRSNVIINFINNYGI
jgi:hypothetical protein